MIYSMRIDTSAPKISAEDRNMIYSIKTDTSAPKVSAGKRNI